MTRWTFIIGALVTVIGIVGFIASGGASFTALIPSLFGVLLIIAAIISRNPKAHRHAIHAALLVALLGVIGTFMNVLKFGDLLNGTAERPLAVGASTATFAALVFYLVLGISSFVSARRARSKTPATS